MQQQLLQTNMTITVYNKHAHTDKCNHFNYHFSTSILISWWSLEYLQGNVWRLLQLYY